MSNIKENFVFIHIPKTAGTSIEEIIGGSGHTPIKEIIENKLRYNIKGKIPPVVAFVRNPYDRLVSAYSNITQLGENYSKQNEIDTIPTFTELVRNLDKYGDLTFNIPHFYPQHYFLEYEGELQTHEIYRFENLTVDFNKMKKEFGFSGDLLHKQKSKHKHYKDYYDKELADLTYNFYRRDFELFNYNKEL